ncbi:MAG: winged helix-turn-helix transcriptional regulator [Haloarculaceae archaeon]
MAGDGEIDESKRATLRRFAALGAASPLVGLADASGSGGDADTREAIAGYLSTTPGAHFSKIRDDLDLATGETQYHLRKLETAGVIESRRDGDYRRFFPAGRFSEFEQVALGYLRRTTPRGMVLALLRDPDLSGAELADRVGVSRPSVSKYAAELADAGLLEREDGYRLRRPETLLLLLVRHAGSFDENVRSFAGRADELVSYDP